VEGGQLAIMFTGWPSISGFAFIATSLPVARWTLK
jgi:hypothetical protein